MATKIVIIGGGPGGYTAALRASALGGDVTLIEKEHLGGTCLNWGCIPSKILNHSAKMYQKFYEAAKFGITFDGSVKADMTVLMDKKNKIIEIQRKGIESLMQQGRIKIEWGIGKIKHHGSVEISLKNGGAKTVDYDKLILATGTQPLNVRNFSFDHDSVLSSNDVLGLTRIPKSMVIVGGGVIGCEFACIFSSLGTEVTIIEGMSRLLPLLAVDEEISKLLLKEMKKRKITVMCDTVVNTYEKTDDSLCVYLGISPFTDNPQPKNLKSPLLETEIMAVCIGRTAVSKDLGLDALGLNPSSQGWIEVNDKMETMHKDVFAIGDLLGPQKIMLAHVASHEGIVAAENAMGHDTRMEYDVIPGAIFTDPEIGTVGLSEAEAIKKGLDVESYAFNFRNLGKAQAIDELAGLAKMIVEKRSKKILGVHMIGPRSTDLIAEATLAIKKGLTADDICHIIHAHPTLAEIIGELSFRAAGIF